MPSWGDVLKEIQSGSLTLDGVRRAYLQKLHNYVGRNIIAYYSGWLSNQRARGVDINDMDINGFMTAIQGLDCSLGLDLILHTPGGGISATEHIVSYLKAKFGNNIRAFVPQIAMSAGTMLACSCSAIIMGKQSCIGPIDPQFAGVSARGVVEEFNKAIRETTDKPHSIAIWREIIGKYHPTMIDSCQKAWDRSLTMLKDWLNGNMFKDSQDVDIQSIVNQLADIGHNLGHDKHISFAEAQSMGLKISMLEDDQELQELVLTVHHCFMHTFSGVPTATKIIENHNGAAVVNFG